MIKLWISNEQKC